METSAGETSTALEQVVARYAGMVRAVGLRHGLSEADLDEVMQDVRLRLWHARSTPEKIAGSPASYVYRTAVSAALDLIRRRRARWEEPVDIALVGEEALRGASPTPDVALERSELMDTLTQTIEGLSDARRPVVRMYLVGYSRQEIADLLGWTEAKTRNLLYRGLADLRQGLSQRGIGPEIAR
jgi:RNA polymerase sigma-70 factor (ECF subfamily)